MKEYREILEETGISRVMFNCYKNMGLVDNYAQKVPTPGKKNGGFRYLYNNNVIDQIKEVKRKNEQGISLPQQQKDKWRQESDLTNSSTATELIERFKEIVENNEEEAKQILDSFFKKVQKHNRLKNEQKPVTKMTKSTAQILEKKTAEGRPVFMQIKKQENGDRIIEFVNKKVKNDIEINTDRKIVDKEEEYVILDDLNGNIEFPKRSKKLVKFRFNEDTQKIEAYLPEKIGKK